MRNTQHTNLDHTKNLPIDIKITIMTHLNFQSLSNLILTCKHWRQPIQHQYNIRWASQLNFNITPHIIQNLKLQSYNTNIYQFPLWILLYFVKANIPIISYNNFVFKLNNFATQILGINNRIFASKPIYKELYKHIKHYRNKHKRKNFTHDSKDEPLLDWYDNPINIA